MSNFSKIHLLHTLIYNLITCLEPWLVVVPKLQVATMLLGAMPLSQNLTFWALELVTKIHDQNLLA